MRPNKGRKISKAKGERKNQKRNANRRYLLSKRKQDNEARVLRKQRKAEVVRKGLEDGDDDPVVDKRVSDRKFVENNVKVYKNDLDVHSCGTDLVKLFGLKLESIVWHTCAMCHTRQLGVSKKCWCSKPYVMNSRLLMLGSVPDVLKDLSLIEQLLIARVHPVVQVYRLVGGQTGYSGHVINFFQDVREVATSLPHVLSDVNDIVKVSYDKLLFHKDFKIRKHCVLNALTHLKEKNKYYRDIVIDMNALQSLPEHDFFHGSQADFEESTSCVYVCIYCLYFMLYCFSLIFFLGSNGEDEIVSTAVPSVSMVKPDDKLKHNMTWPNISSDAIKEFSTPYLVQAFPCLFPNGEGDLQEVKSKRLTARVYFQYLMEFEDGRFADHKIFPYFALNSVMRWQCLSKGTVYIKDHPSMKKMNIGVLKDLVLRNPSLMKDMLVYGSNIRGTLEFWASRSSELNAFCDFRGLPTIFFTSSAADMRWPRLKELVLHRLGLESATDKEYYQHVIDHPKICADYFFEMFTLFFERIVLGAYDVLDYWYRYEWQVMFDTSFVIKINFQVFFFNFLFCFNFFRCVVLLMFMEFFGCEMLLM